MRSKVEQQKPTKYMQNMNEQPEYLTDEAARKLALSVGQGMLATLAEELPAKCEKPWDEDGHLTCEGATAVDGIIRSWVGQITLVATRITRKMAEKCLSLYQEEELQRDGLFYGPGFRRETILASLSFLEEHAREIDAVRARGGSIEEELGISPKDFKRAGKR